MGFRKMPPAARPLCGCGYQRVPSAWAARDGKERMLAISTAYWPSLEDGQKILDEADRLGFSAIEISTYTGRKALDEMLPALRRR